MSEIFATLEASSAFDETDSVEVPAASARAARAGPRGAWTVAQQIAAGFGALAAVVVTVSAATLHALGQANAALSSLVSVSAVQEQLAAEVRGAAILRALAARDMVLAKSVAQRAEEKAATMRAHADTRALLDRLHAAVYQAPDSDERERALLATLERVETSYEPVLLGIVQLADDGRTDEAVERLNVDCRPLLDALRTAASDYIAYSHARSRRELDAAETAYGEQRVLLTGLSTIGIAVAVAVGLYITRRLSRALGAEPGALVEAARRVAAGDLGPVAGADAASHGSVLDSMAEMQRQLVRLIGRVRTSSESIATASAQIATGNADLSSRTEQQASALQESAASLQQMTETVRRNAHTAQQASELAASATLVAARGGEAVQRAVATMEEIQASSRRIGDIIGVIDGIAFQTNFLALNAAVEAARAGTHGRGFAVVAAEVRTLAQRSAEAAREIKQLIEDSGIRVAAGGRHVGDAGTTMQEIVNHVRRVDALLGDISAATLSQSGGIAQISQAVSALDTGTQQNAALVEESAAAAESLRHQAKGLTQLVAAFRM